MINFIHSTQDILLILMASVALGVGTTFLIEGVKAIYRKMTKGGQG